MPNRIIREGLNDSLRVNALSELAELFYRKLLLLVDDFGRYEAEPKLLKAKLYGLREKTAAEVEAYLIELTGTNRPLIHLYEIDGKKYLEVCDFNQRIRPNTVSRFPPYSAEFGGEVRRDCARASAPTTHTPPTPITPPKEESARETKSQIQLDESWNRFEETAQAAGMGGSDEEWITLSAFVWPRLDWQQKLTAIETIKRRSASGEYANGFTPLARSYLEKKLWTRPDRAQRPKRFDVHEYLQPTGEAS